MRTLLLADDNVTVQRVIALTFATEDFRVVTVSDGQAAIERIKSQPPDIVLAGSAMPNVSGYDVASFVRSQPALNNLPVLLLTGAFEAVDPERLKTSGASGVLEKPLDPTTVISRVKDLLGIKGDARPTPTPAPGRLVTPADSPADKKQPLQREAPASSQARHSEPPPVRASKAASWDELRETSGLAPDARSVEGGNGSGTDDYLDTLDAAFDSLDQKLAGHADDSSRHSRAERRDPPERNNRDDRNPAPPLAHHGTAVDPRSPSRRPVAPVPQEAPSASAIFEVDDEWFTEGKKDREERLAEQKALVAEMGMRDIELPDAAAAAAGDAAASNADLDFEFSPDGEPKPAQAPAPPPEPARVTPSRAPATVAPMPPRRDEAHLSGAPRSVTAQTPAAARDVADDFAALLAFEQGEHPPPPAPSPPAPASAPVIVPAPAPEITDAMLDQIAERVADRLNAGRFADHLREAMTATVRDTVRAAVSETSERLVRDEIARVKAQAERDTR